MFDSPFAFCPRCGEMVLLDQTPRECAREHGCGREPCPLVAWFSGVDFREAANKGEADEPGK